METTINDTRPPAEEEHPMPVAAPLPPPAITSAAVDVLEGVKELRVEAERLCTIATELEELRTRLEGKTEADMIPVRASDVLIPVPAGELCQHKREEMGRAFAALMAKVRNVGAACTRADEAGCLPAKPLQITHEPHPQDSERMAQIRDQIERDLAEMPRDLDEDAPIPRVVREPINERPTAPKPSIVRRVMASL